MVCYCLCENEHLLFQLLQSRDVLAENVELDVDDRAHPDVAEIGVLHGVGDDGHLERVLGGVADGQRHTVDGDGTFVNGEIPFTSHFAVLLVFEGEVGRAISVFFRYASSSFIDMSLYDMAVQPAVHQHRALNIDLVVYLEKSKVGAVKCFFHCSNGIGSVFYLDHSKAYTVVGDTLVDAQFIDKRAAQNKINIVSVFMNSYNGSKFLNNTGKHRSIKMNLE